MEHQQHDTESSVAKDGVTVYQTYEEDRFGVPTVGLKLVSDRDDSVHVRLVVDLPTDLDIEEVGFHPNYRREDWTVENDRLEFEAELERDDEVTTMYAVEALQPTQLDALLDNLYLDRVASLADTPEADQSQATSDTASTDSTSREPASDENESDVAETDAHSRAASETERRPDESGAEHGTRAPADPDEEDSAAAGTATDADQVTEAPHESDADEDDEDSDELWGRPTASHAEESPDDELHEIETMESVEDERLQSDGPTADESSGSGDASSEVESNVHSSGESDADVTETLGDESEPSEEHSASTATAETSESGALSEYSAAELIAELADRLDDADVETRNRDRIRTALQDEAGRETGTDDRRIAHLQQRISDLEAFLEPLQQLDERHGNPADVFEEFEEQLETLSEDIDAMNERVVATENRVEDIEPRLDSLDDDLHETRDEIEHRVESIEDDIADIHDSVDETLETMEPRLDALEDDVETVTETQESLESEVSKLSEWRDNVKSVLEKLSG